MSADSIDINKESHIFYKFRPIHYSIANNQKECFDILQQKSADLTGILFSSVHFNNIDFLNLILWNNLEDVNYYNSKNQPPAIIESIKNTKSTKIAQILLEKGATYDDDLVEFCESNPEFKEFLEILNQYKQQNITIKPGILTPLHIAADQNNFEEAQRIIEEGKVDINAVTDNGDTALMKAAHRGSLKIVQLILEQKKVQIDVNQINKGGILLIYFFFNKTALHHACIYAKKNVVLYLLRVKGIDPLIRTIFFLIFFFILF